MPQHSTSMNFYTQINYINADFRSMQSFYSYSREQEQPPHRSSHHALLAFIVPVLLTALQIRYQAKQTTPFETHPRSITIAVASLLVYCFLCDAEVKLSSIRCRRTYTVVVCRGKAYLASLPWVSLATILLPDSLAPLLYSLFILFSAVELLISSPFRKLSNWLEGHGFLGMEAVLPV